MANPKGHYIGSPAYHEGMPDLVRQLAIDEDGMGRSKKEIFIELGVSKETFYTWIKEKPEFAAAVSEAIDASECATKKLITRKAINGDKIACSWLIFMMKNVYKWKDSVTIDDNAGKPREALIAGLNDKSKTIVEPD